MSTSSHTKGLVVDGKHSRHPSTQPARCGIPVNQKGVLA